MLETVADRLERRTGDGPTGQSHPWLCPPRFELHCLQSDKLRTGLAKNLAQYEHAN